RGAVDADDHADAGPRLPGGRNLFTDAGARGPPRRALSRRAGPRVRRAGQRHRRGRRDPAARRAGEALAVRAPPGSGRAGFLLWALLRVALLVRGPLVADHLAVGADRDRHLSLRGGDHYLSVRFGLELPLRPHGLAVSCLLGDGDRFGQADHLRLALVPG